MKSEFALAFNQICAEYGLPREVVLDAVRAALAKAFERDSWMPGAQNVTADIDLETGTARIYVDRIVVEEVSDPQTEISLQEARRSKPNAQIGDVIRIDVTPRDFGRIAAQTAKQVITQRLREAERESQFNRFSRQEGEIIIGTVQSISPQGVKLHLERTEEALMPRREQIPGERYTIHQKIRVYVLEVRRTPRGPEIIVSRSHPLMLRRLLELEVPEIKNGQVEINAIAREPGTRAKVAVSTRQPGIDPVGACVGMRGIRIQNISRELHGERIDVVQWVKDPAAFIANALSVPNILSIVLDENHPDGRTASVVVPDEHLSLAIGRSGQNARLAAKLTGWRVDIQGASEAALWTLEQINKTPELVDMLKGTASAIPRLASIMRMHEEERYPYTDEERRIIGSVVKAVRQALIAKRDAERPGASQERARQRAQRHAEAERVRAREAARARVPKAAYNVPLSALEFSQKVRSHLINNGLRSLGEIMERMALGDEALLMLNGVGVKALREIKAAVEASGFALLSETEAEEKEGISETEPAVEKTATEPEPTSVVEPQKELKEAVPEVASGDEAGVLEELAQPPVAVSEGLEPGTQDGTQEESSAEDSGTEQGSSEPAPEAVFDATALLAEPELEEVLLDESFEDEPELEEDRLTPKKKKRRKRRRTVLYDDTTGQTIVMRRHRRRNKDGWDEFEDDY